MIYMKSSNTSDGRMLLDVNFEVGMDQDTANVLTQNRVSTAAARLPAEVNQQGVTVKKQSPSMHTTQTFLSTTAASTCATRSFAFRASRKWTCLAEPITGCAYGYGQTVWPSSV
jgi:multidrug efflux pump subunit AcrB